MSFDLRSLEIQVITKSFEDEIEEKEFLLQQIQQNFICRCSLSKQNKDHPSFLKYTREMIEMFEKIYKDLYSFFLDLRIGSVYTLFQKMFKLMILGYKTLSQLLIQVSRKKFQKTEKYNFDSEKWKKNNDEKSFKMKMQNTEKIDNFLNEIQFEQMRINKEKDILERNLFVQKKTVENIRPSDAINEIKQLKEILQKILTYSQNVVHEDYMFRHQQLNNFILKLKKPAFIKQQILKDLSANLKQTFIRKISQFITTICAYFKKKQNQVITKTIEDKRLAMVQSQTQTFITMNDIIKVEKHKQNTENQPPQEQGKSKRELIKENNSLAKRLKEVEGQLDEIKEKYSILENILKKKNIEIDHTKTDWDWEMKKKNSLIEKLNEKLSQLRSYRGHEFSTTGVNCDKIKTYDKYIQVESEAKTEFNKTVEKKKDKKQMNFLSKVDKKKEEQKAMIIHCINRILQDLGINLKADDMFEDGICDITKRIREQIAKFKDKKTKMQRIINNYNEEKKNKFLRQKIAFTQTVDSKVEICFGQIKQSNEEEDNQTILTNGKLDRLKKQLMQKVQAQKKKRQSGRKSDKNEPNKFIDNENRHQQIIKKEKQHFRLSKRQITFQELKISRRSQKMHDFSSRFLLTSNSPGRMLYNEKKIKRTEQTRNSNSLPVETNENQLQKSSYNLLTIENSSIIVELNRLFTELFKKKDNKNEYKNIFLYLLNRMGKQLGKPFITECFSSFLKKMRQQD